MIDIMQVLLAIFRDSCYFEDQKQVLLAKNLDNFRKTQ